MTDDIKKLLDLFSLTLLQDSFFIFQQAWELSVYTLPISECTVFSLTGLQLSRGLAVCSAKLGLNYSD